MKVRTMTIDEIIPGVYIGAYSDTIDNSNLFQLNITHVINLSQIANNNASCFDMYNININDYPDSNISEYFSKTSRFICNALVNKKNVLVYCFAGMSRSVSIVIAFLIRKRRMTFESALQLVKSKRNCAEPNSGFTQQLIHLSCRCK